MTSLSLHLLGPFQADLDSQAMTDFRTRKVQALLIYLATETQAHQRDLLLDLLWPGLPERSARSNLRQTIYGRNSYRAVSEAYILFTTVPNPPVPGLPRGLQRITLTIQVTQNQFTSDTTAEFFDVDGNLVITLCVTASGQRMSLDDFGIGAWGLEIGDCAIKDRPRPNPNPQSLIPLTSWSAPRRAATASRRRYRG